MYVREGLEPSSPAKRARPRSLNPLYVREGLEHSSVELSHKTSCLNPLYVREGLERLIQIGEQTYKVVLIPCMSGKVWNKTLLMIR